MTGAARWVPSADIDSIQWEDAEVTPLITVAGAAMHDKRKSSSSNMPRDGVVAIEAGTGKLLIVTGEGLPGRTLSPNFTVLA